ncbi:MAG: hypothetical protein ACRCXC_05560 [Legionella sp.]
MSKFHHHESGKTQAAKLELNIQRCENTESAMEQLQQFMEKANYHTHSFSSYILDQLIDSGSHQKNMNWKTGAK